MDLSSEPISVPPALDPKDPWRLKWVAQTGSTNADLMAAAATGAPTHSVLVADHQSAGRGRRGRNWSAPAGASLLVSILLRPDMAATHAHLAAVAVALSASDACDATVGLRPGLKWPNDLVVEDGTRSRKLAGVLSESLTRAGRIEAVVVGIGINVNWPQPMPAEFREATALSHLCEASPERTELLAAMLEALTPRVELFDSASGRSALRAEVRERCVTIGRRVRVEMTEGEITGTATDIADGGHLVVQTSTGRQTVTVGDVVHLR